jgi:uncharacterized protein
MEQDRAFERKYSINVARLKLGKHSETFEIDRAFFEHMGTSLISEGEVEARLEKVKYNTHLDAKFFISGTVQVECDRCGHPYPQAITEQRRIIYAFSESMKFDGYEVIYVDPDEPELSLVQELYDFVHLALPMRKVPEPAVHICPPEVLEVLGLDEHGEPLPEAPVEEAEPSDEPVDERWAVLKKLRDQMED